MKLSKRAEKLREATANAQSPRANRTHGMSYTQIYDAWSGMKSRCTNAKNKDYKHYGGRGIKVCKKWLRFRGFLEDMGLRPEPHLTLDRIDNSKGYSKANCRWATRSVQTANRNVKFVCRNGHVRTKENTTRWRRSDGKTIQRCRVCSRIAVAKYAAKKRIK